MIWKLTLGSQCLERPRELDRNSVISLDLKHLLLDHIADELAPGLNSQRSINLVLIGLNRFYGDSQFFGNLFGFISECHMSGDFDFSRGQGLFDRHLGLLGVEQERIGRLSEGIFNILKVTEIPGLSSNGNPSRIYSRKRPGRLRTEDRRSSTRPMRLLTLLDQEVREKLYGNLLARLVAVAGLRQDHQGVGFDEGKEDMRVLVP